MFIVNISFHKVQWKLVNVYVLYTIISPIYHNITNHSHSHFIDFAFRDSFTEIWKVKVLSSAECVPSVTRVLCGCPGGAWRAIAARERGGRPHYIGQHQAPGETKQVSTQWPSVGRHGIFEDFPDNPSHPFPTLSTC